MPIHLGGWEKVKLIVGGTIYVNAKVAGLKMGVIHASGKGADVGVKVWQKPGQIYRSVLNRRTQQRVKVISSMSAWNDKFGVWDPSLSGYLDYMEYHHNFDVDGAVTRVVAAGFDQNTANEGRDKVQVRLIVHNSNRERLKRVEYSSVPTGEITLWTDGD